jgi:peptidoglycan hydrolase CwlO-like protein
VTLEPPPQGAPIRIPQLTRALWVLVWSIPCTIAGGYIGLIYVLVSVISTGINDRLNSLEDHFQAAIVASGDVKRLLETAPTLQHDITETHDAVIKLQGSMEMLNQKIGSNQEKTTIQLENIQKQIHAMPGVPK